VRGDCLLCDCDGYLAIPDLKPGENSFSASFWFYLDTALTIEQSCDVVFSNNTYEDRNSDGFYFRIGDSIVSLDICSDGVSAQLGGRVPRVAKIHRLPEEFDGGWMHVIVCFDREQRTYRAYLGFKEIGSAEIPEVFDGKSLDGCGTLRQALDAKPFLVRYLLILGCLLATLYYGVWGPAFGAAAFVYLQF